MPFCLANSVFQEFMNEVFREFLQRCVIVYSDNILIYSRNRAVHRPTRQAGPSEAPTVSSLPEAREMRFPSTHHAVPRLCHQSRGYPDGPREGESSQGMANPSICQGASKNLRIRQLLSSLHQGFQFAHRPTHRLTSWEAQVPVLES